MIQCSVCVAKPPKSPSTPWGQDIHKSKATSQSELTHDDDLNDLVNGANRKEEPDDVGGAAKQKKSQDQDKSSSTKPQKRQHKAMVVKMKKKSVDKEQIICFVDDGQSLLMVCRWKQKEVLFKIWLLCWQGVDWTTLHDQCCRVDQVFESDTMTKVFTLMCKVNWQRNIVVLLWRWL